MTDTSRDELIAQATKQPANTLNEHVQSANIHKGIMDQVASDSRAKLLNYATEGRYTQRQQQVQVSEQTETPATPKVKTSFNLKQLTGKTTEELEAESIKHRKGGIFLSSISPEDRGYTLIKTADGKYHDVNDESIDDKMRISPDTQWIRGGWDKLPEDAKAHILSTGKEQLAERATTGKEIEGEGLQKFVRGDSVMHMDGLEGDQDRGYAISELFDKDGNMINDAATTVMLLDRVDLPREEKINLMGKIYGNYDPYGTGIDPAVMNEYIKSVAFARSGIDADRQASGLGSDLYNLADNILFNIPAYIAKNQGIPKELSSKVYTRTKDYLDEDPSILEGVNNVLGKLKFEGGEEDLVINGVDVTIEADDTKESVNDKLHVAYVDKMVSQTQHVSETGAQLIGGGVIGLVNPYTIVGLAAKGVSYGAKAVKLSQLVGKATQATALGSRVAKAGAVASKAANTNVAQAGKAIATGALNGYIYGRISGYQGMEHEAGLYGAVLGGGFGAMAGAKHGIKAIGSAKRGAMGVIQDIVPENWKIKKYADSKILSGVGDSLEQGKTYDALTPRQKKMVTKEGYEQMLEQQKQSQFVDNLMEAKYGEGWANGKNDPAQRQHFLTEAMKDEGIQKTLDEFILNTTNGQHTVRSLNHQSALSAHFGDGPEARAITSRFDDVLGDETAFLTRLQEVSPENYNVLARQVTGHSSVLPYDLLVKDVLSVPPSTTLKTLASAQDQIYSLDTGITTHMKRIMTDYIKNPPAVRAQAIEGYATEVLKSVETYSRMSHGINGSAKRMATHFEQLADSAVTRGEQENLSRALELGGLMDEISEKMGMLSRKEGLDPSEIDILLHSMNDVKKRFNDHASGVQGFIRAPEKEFNALYTQLDTLSKSILNERKAMSKLNKSLWATKMLQEVEGEDGAMVRSASFKDMDVASIESKMAYTYDRISSPAVKVDEVERMLNGLSPQSSSVVGLHATIANEIKAGVKIALPANVKTSDKVRTMVRIHNDTTDIVSRANSVISSPLNEASKYSSLRRLANSAPTEDARKALLEASSQYVEVVGRQVNGMPLPVKDKVRILRAVHTDIGDDISDVMSGKMSVEELVENLNIKSFADDILQMQETLGTEIVSRYRQLYRDQFNGELNVAEFLGFFLTKAGGYDGDQMLMKVLLKEKASVVFAPEWGRQVAKHAERDYNLSMGGKTSSGGIMKYRGYDAFQSDFASKTGVSAMDAVTQKNIAHKRSKNDLDEIMQTYVTGFMKRIHSDPDTKELWTLLKGVDGFDKKFNTHLFTETGGVEMTAVGKVIKGFVDSPDFEAFRKLAIRGDSTLDDIADVARTGLRTSFVKQGLSDVDVDGLGSYFSTYFRTGGKVYSKGQWARAWENIAEEAMIDMRKLQKVNQRIGENNAMWAHKGYQIPTIKHRQFRLTNTLMANDTFLSANTHMRTVESRLFHRHSSSSDMGQVAKLHDLKLHQVADPIESITKDVRDMIRYGNTVHASSALDDLGVLSGSFGFKAHASWLAQEAGSAMGLYQQHFVSTIMYNLRKRSALIATASNAVNSIVSSFVTLVSPLSLIMTTLQAGVTHAGTVGLGKGNMLKAIPIQARRLVGMPIKLFARTISIFKYDLEGMVRYVEKSSDPATNRILNEVINALGDAPVRGTREARLAAVAGKRQLTTAEKGSLWFGEQIEVMNAGLFKALKERTERFVSRDILDEGLKAYTQIQKFIEEGRINDARGLLDTLAPAMRRSDSFDITNTIALNLKRGTPDVGMKRFLESYHDSIVGRFGFHTAPQQIKQLSHIIPGASQFYASKMLALTRVVQYATGAMFSGVKNQSCFAGNMYAMTSLIGLSVTADALGRGDTGKIWGGNVDDETSLGSSIRAGLFPGTEKANPLPTEVLSMIYGGARAVGLPVGTGPRDKEASITLETLIQMAITATPSTRVSASNYAGLDLVSKLNFLTSSMQVGSQVMANVISSLTPTQEFNANLGFKLKHSNLVQNWQQANSPEEREKALNKMLEVYGKYEDQVYTNFYDTIYSKTVFGAVTKGILDNPFAFMSMMRDIDSEGADPVQDAYSKYSEGKGGKEGHIPVYGAWKDNILAQGIGKEFYEKSLVPLFGLPDTTLDELLLRYDNYLNRLSEMEVVTDAEKASFRKRFKVYAEGVYQMEAEDEAELDSSIINEWIEKREDEEQQR